jgi:hypothetical protein
VIPANGLYASVDSDTLELANGGVCQLVVSSMNDVSRRLESHAA